MKPTHLPVTRHHWLHSIFFILHSSFYISASVTRHHWPHSSFSILHSSFYISAAQAARHLRLLAAFFILHSTFFISASAPADTRLIAKLDIRDTGFFVYNASHWLEQAGIHPGAPLYGDNENLPEPDRAAIATLPAPLIGADWIQPSARSTTFTRHHALGDTLAAFELREDAEIYIAHSDAIAQKPDWLAPHRYTPTPEKLTDTLNRTFTLYKRAARKGDLIALGPNHPATAGLPDSPAAPTAQSTDPRTQLPPPLAPALAPMYLIIVKPLAPTPPKSDTPHSPLSIPHSALRIPHSTPPTLPTIDIHARGALPDARTINTTIIQTAIDELAARDGGTLLIRGGIYLSGALELKDNITLRIEAGSILRASPNPADFPPRQVTLPGFRSHEPHQFLFANQRRNITITGGGIIDGYALRYGHPWGGRNNEHERPRLIRMFSCRDIHLENITLVRAANWTQYYESCTNLTFRDLRIRCHTGVHNQDGIDISGCTNVEITDYYATTGDDVICLKALTLTPAENIRITNVFTPYANCNLIKIGTETHGALKNVHVSNVEGVTRYSLAIQTVDGTILENITYENMTLHDCGSPISARLGARGRTFAGGPNPATPGAMRNITFRNIRNYANNYGAEKRGIGIGSPLAGLRDLRIQNLTIEDCDLIFHGGQHDPKTVTRDIPENADKYPEYITFGHCPAYGLYLRHIDGLTLRNTRIRAQNPDIRPAIVLENVTHPTLENITTQTFPQTTPSAIWTK